VGQAVLVIGKFLRAVAFYSMDDFLRRFPFAGRPAALEILVGIMGHRTDNLFGRLGAAFVFLLGGNLFAGGQVPWAEKAGRFRIKKSFWRVTLTVQPSNLSIYWPLSL
jgi:hypothetical protein